MSASRVKPRSMSFLSTRAEAVVKSSAGVGFQGPADEIDLLRLLF